MHAGVRTAGRKRRVWMRRRAMCCDHLLVKWYVGVSVAGDMTLLVCKCHQEIWICVKPRRGVLPCSKTRCDSHSVHKQGMINTSFKVFTHSVCFSYPVFPCQVWFTHSAQVSDFCSYPPVAAQLQHPEILHPSLKNTTSLLFSDGEFKVIKIDTEGSWHILNIEIHCFKNHCYEYLWTKLGWLSWLKIGPPFKQQGTILW